MVMKKLQTCQNTELPIILSTIKHLHSEDRTRSVREHYELLPFICFERIRLQYRQETIWDFVDDTLLTRLRT